MLCSGCGVLNLEMSSSLLRQIGRGFTVRSRSFGTSNRRMVESVERPDVIGGITEESPFQVVQPMLKR